MLVVACWLDDWIAMVEVWSVVCLAAAAEYRDLLPPVHPGHQSRQTEETFLLEESSNSCGSGSTVGCSVSCGRELCSGA